MEVSNGIVILLGLGIVFISLICIVFICTIMGSICKMLIKPEEKTESVSAPAPQSAASPIADKQKIIAGVCAVIAEELGTDVNSIRVTSFKRI